MKNYETDYVVKVSINDVAKTNDNKDELHQLLKGIANDHHSYESLLTEGISNHYFNNLVKAAEFVDICKTKGKEPLNAILTQANGNQLYMKDVDRLTSLRFYEFNQKRDGSIE